MRRYRKKNKLKVLLVLLLIGLSVGYALLNSNLKIVGHSGINKNTWDIHWNPESINVTNGSVAAKTAAHVSDAEMKNIDFEAELDLPGDFYEFTMEAKNYGTVSGEIKEIIPKIYKVDLETEEETIIETLPSYLKYSLTHIDGSEIEKDEVLEKGKSVKYKFRIEYDANSKQLPGNDDPKKIKTETIVDVTQTDTGKEYNITYNPNGGVVNPSTKKINQGEELFNLPTPTKDGSSFIGWYTGLTDGSKIDEETIPTKDTTYYARWNETLPVFDTGKKVNEKIKRLAEDELPESMPYVFEDTTIKNIVRSTVAPDISTMTEDNIISASSSSDPIYAWFDTDTIYYWSEKGKEYLNPDSSYMFGKFSSLENLDITNIYTNNLQDASYMFANSSVPELDFSDKDLSNVSDMSYMFVGSTLAGLDMSDVNTPNLTTTAYMFAQAQADSIDLNDLDTGRVTTMEYMFVASNIPEIVVENFDTKNVTNISFMFNGTKVKDLDLSNWNVRKVTNMDMLFCNASELETLNIDTWKTDSLTAMNCIFNGAVKLKRLDLSGFDVSKVSIQSNIFSGCNELEYLDISGWDFSSTSSMNSLFQLPKLETIKLDNVNTSHVTSMSLVFYNCSLLKEIDLRSFDISNVSTANRVFYGCTGLEKVNISGWDFKSAGSISSMFAGLTNLKEVDVSNVKNVTDANNMFAGDSALTTINMKGFDASKITSISYMFSGCSSLTSIDFSEFYADSLEQMTSVFQGCTGLTSLDLSTFNTKKVFVGSCGIVYGCTNLETINLSNWDMTQASSFTMTGILGKSDVKTIILDRAIFPMATTNSFSGLTAVEELSLKNVDTTRVQYPSGMFQGVTTLTTLDLSSFDTRNFVSPTAMFAGMTNLTTIYVGDDFVFTDKLMASDGMFSDCTSLVGGAGTVYDPEHIDAEYAHYDEGETNPGYFNRKAANVHTVTFNPNGGSVSPTTKEVADATLIGSLPTPTREGYGFDGWYTSLTDGIKVTEKYAVYNDITLYAIWVPSFEIIYNSTTGKFSDDSTTNTIKYDYANELITKYSHTPNIDDDGNASSVYEDNLQLNDIVTIPGATQLNIDVIFTTEDNYDWLAIYPDGITPTNSNYNSAKISNGKLYGHNGFSGYERPGSDNQVYHKTFVVSGDTAQFYFKSDSSTGYYGYYAIVTANIKGYQLSDDYEEPTKEAAIFDGWNTKEDGSEKMYTSESSIIKDAKSLVPSTSLYAIWHDYDKYKIKFNANGGKVEEKERIVIEGNEIGALPVPTRYNYGFLGWYVLDEGLKIDKTYKPTSSITLYAKWGSCNGFNEASWDEINRNVNSNPKKYAVGCTKSIDLGNYGIHKLRVANNTKPSECKVKGNSQSACGFVLEFADIVTTHRMNPWDPYASSSVTGNGNRGSWEYSEMRSFVNDDIYNSIPSDLRNLIVDTYVVTGRGYNDANASKTIDKLYLLSPKEVYGLGEYSFGNDELASSTRQLDYYNNNGVPTNAIPTQPNIELIPKKNYNKISTYWWLRAPVRDETSRLFFEVTGDGVAHFGESNAEDSTGVSPAFRIGNSYTVTFNANGGVLEQSQKEVEKNTKIRNLPIPTREGYGFDGWYTGLTDGVLLNDEYVVTSDIEIFAHWVPDKTFTFDANTGKFSNNENIKNITYKHLSEAVVKHSSTSNVDGEGVAVNGITSSSGVSETITIPNAKSLKIEVWYQTGSGSYLAIYPKEVTPTSSNYDQATISGGKLSGGTSLEKPKDNSEYHKTYIVEGNTAKFYFYASPLLYSYEKFYGYYATITASSVSYSGDKEFEEPVKNEEYKFIGWNTKQDGTGTQYDTEEDIKNDIDSLENGSILYAQWHKYENYTITLNANGGNVDTSTITGVEEHRLLPMLPTPTTTEENYVFAGWYTGLTDGVRINLTYEPTEDITLYARWKLYVDWATSSWDDIVQAYNEEEKLEVLQQSLEAGQIREVDLGSLGVHNLRIANLSKCPDTLTSKTACGFVVEFADIISQENMSEYSDNEGGWKYSDIRDYLGAGKAVMESLPQDLKNVIINTRVISSHGRTENTNYDTNDKLYLFSPREIWNYSNSTYDSASSNSITRQLDYYSIKGVTSSSYDAVIKDYNGTAASWWMRSAYSDTKYSFYYANSYGKQSTTSPNNAYGVSPAFRIAE